MADTVVVDMQTLKSMEKAGLIILHKDTGCIVPHWTGQRTTAYYVDNTVDGNRAFEFKNKAYELTYFEGCFMPFVVDVEVAKQYGVYGQKLIA